jgi:hypothetical protein
MGQRKLVRLAGLVAGGLALLPLGSAQAAPIFIDDFSLVKNGALAFRDPFSDGVPPPSAPNFTNGTPASYAVLGTMNESGGKVQLDTVGAAIRPGIGTSRFFSVEQGLLLTNIDQTNLALGLKNDDTFSVTGIFDLAVPAANLEYYGVRLADFAGTVLGNDLLELAVRRASDGVDRVQFFRLDQIANTFTPIASALLQPGHDQISLTLARTDATSDEITASFFYVDGGVPGQTTTFLNTSDIFNGENFTRAAFIFVTPASVPEPSILLILSSGLAALAGTAWRRRHTES